MYTSPSFSHMVPHCLTAVIVLHNRKQEIDIAIKCVYISVPLNHGIDLFIPLHHLKIQKRSPLPRFPPCSLDLYYHPYPLETTGSISVILSLQQYAVWDPLDTGFLVQPNVLEVYPSCCLYQEFALAHYRVVLCGVDKPLFVEMFTSGRMLGLFLVWNY